MKTYAKAITGGVISTLTTLTALASDGTISGIDVLAAVTAGAVSFGAVYGIRNGEG